MQYHKNWDNEIHSYMNSIRMRTCLPFLIRDANSCIDCQPHKGCPRVEIMPLFILHTQFAISAFFMEIFFHYSIGFENGQNLKLIFEMNA